MQRLNNVAYTSATHNDGDSLEALVAASMIFSSHCVSMKQKLSALDWIPRMLEELVNDMNVFCGFTVMSISTNIVEGYLSKVFVPYLSPPNSPWPSELLDVNEEGYRFGCLTQNSNSEERCLYLLGCIAKATHHS
jgi:hypothetical protein